MMTSISSSFPRAAAQVKNDPEQIGRADRKEQSDNDEESVIPLIFTPQYDESVSVAVPVPFGNSLHFKAGGLNLAWNAVQHTVPQHAIPTALVQANRMGYAVNGMAGNALRAIGLFGQLGDPGSSQSDAATLWQIAKGLGNSIGYAIDFSNVQDKRATVRNYLFSPVKQRTYSRLISSPERGEVELRELGRRPATSEVRKNTRTTADSGAQTSLQAHEAPQSPRGATTQLDAHAQTVTSDIHRATQTSVQAPSQHTQTDPDQEFQPLTGAKEEHRGTQTEALAHHDTPQAAHSSKAGIAHADTVSRTEIATQGDGSPQMRKAALDRETPIRVPLLTDHRAGPAGIGRTSQASVETRNRGTQKTEWRTDTTAAPLARDRSTQILSMAPGSAHPAAASRHWHDIVPASVKGNGHWVGIDAFALISDVKNLTDKPSALGAMTLSADVASSAGDLVAAANIGGREMLALASKSLSAAGTVLGIVPSSVQLANDIKVLVANPNSEQAKWNVGNDSVHLFGGLAAAAAAFAFPPAAAAALLFPNFAEIHHAEVLRGEVNKLRAEGRNTEADALHTEYQEAALNATPLVNWFGPIYRRAMRPAVESFEIAQGNKPQTPPKDGVPHELPANATEAAKKYYQTALSEREKSFAKKAKSYLKSISENARADSVTLISRSPQMFGWPSTGQPMRAFERAVAITYSKHDNSVSARFLSPMASGLYSVPPLDGIEQNGKMKNLMLVGNMLDPDEKKIKFDLSGYKNGSLGDVKIVDPKHYVV